MDNASMMRSQAWGNAGRIPKRATALPGPQQSIRIREAASSEHSHDDHAVDGAPAAGSGRGLDPADNVRQRQEERRRWQRRYQPYASELSEDDADVGSGHRAGNRHRSQSRSPVTRRGRNGSDDNGELPTMRTPKPSTPSPRVTKSAAAGPRPSSQSRSPVAPRCRTGSDDNGELPLTITAEPTPPPPPKVTRATPLLSPANSTKVSAIAHTLLLSALELYLSSLNAWKERAWHFETFEQYVYLASSAMEFMGLFQILMHFCSRERDPRFLGEPLVILSTGVLDDDLDVRIEGFNRTVVQALASMAMFGAFIYARVEHADWSVGAIGLLLAILGVGLSPALRGRRSAPAPTTNSAGGTGADGGASLERGTNPGRTGQAQIGSIVAGVAGRRREVPRWIFITTLPFSPVVVDILESVFLLRGEITQDSLLLVTVDLIAVVPAIYWVGIQGYYSIFKRA